MPSLRWTIAAAITLLVVFIAGTVYFRELRRIFHLHEALNEGAVRLAEKERSVKEYREKINFYQTEEGIIHLAREQYNMAFSDDRVYIIVNTSGDLAD
ncbi:MAG: septum formation initiator [Synergistaceae bacterium]|jgi:hypothetical protein|nr:septum formation initiator [Synergistaceae bacterium]